MLPLTPPRLASIRVDRDGPLVPRKPSLAQLKHGQHITSWSGWRACREHQRWSDGTYLLLLSRGRALSVALPRGSPWCSVLSSSFSSSSFVSPSKNVRFIVVLSSPLRGHDALETTVERGFFERERKKRSVLRAGAAVETGPVVARSSADSSRCTVPTPLAL